MQRFIAALVMALSLTGLVHASALAAKAKPRGEQVVRLTVTRKGFEPASVHLKAGQPVRLVVTRTVARTCATEIVIKDLGIQKPLPLNTPVEVRFTPGKPGTLRYACAMDMIAGSLLVD